jgi:hypothetical protein
MAHECIKDNSKVALSYYLSASQIIAIKRDKDSFRQEDKYYPIEYRNLMLLEGRNTSARTYRENRSKLSTCPKGWF